MENDRTGYIVEYSKKNGVFSDYEERKNILCSREKLVELLQKHLSGTVWKSQWINIDEYIRNHPNEILEEKF